MPRERGEWSWKDSFPPSKEFTVSLRFIFCPSIRSSDFRLWIRWPHYHNIVKMIISRTKDSMVICPTQKESWYLKNEKMKWKKWKHALFHFLKTPCNEWQLPTTNSTQCKLGAFGTWINFFNCSVLVDHWNPKGCSFQIYLSSGQRIP